MNGHAAGRIRSLQRLRDIAGTGLAPEARAALEDALGLGATPEEALAALLAGGPDWADVASLDDLTEGAVLTASAFGMRLAVGRAEGRIFAIDATCPHANGPLDRGQLQGTTLSCPVHGFDFDVRTGACLTDERASVRCLEVTVEGARVRARRPGAAPPR